MMKRFLTSKEAADYLGILESELNSLSEAKKIPVYKIGGIYTRFKVDELESYRRKGVTTGKAGKSGNSAIDNIRDFFYFNDFYIYSTLAIIVILYLIFKKS